MRIEVTYYSQNLPYPTYSLDTKNMTGGLVTKYVRQTAEHYVRSGECIRIPDFLPQNLTQQKACYISIYENHGKRIRAMWGSLFPRQKSLAQEMITNTIEAIQKHSINEIRQTDMPYLRYSVAVLNPLERITSYGHLNPNTHGLYIKSDSGKHAVVLSQRAGIETPQEQIATAMRESRINTQHESVIMYRFLVENYDE